LPRATALGALGVAVAGVPLSCGDSDDSPLLGNGGTSGVSGHAGSSGVAGTGGTRDSGSGGSPSGGRSGSLGTGGAADASETGGSSGAAGANGSGGAAGSSGAGGTEAGASGSSGAADSGDDAIGECRGLPLADAGTDSGAASCSGSTRSVDHVVDLLFVLDRSISMGERVPPGQTRWEALRAAFSELAQTPQLSGLKVGIQFFSLSGTANDTVDCNATNYATPAVPMGPLADVGDDILAAVTNRLPGGLTPIVPAVQGSLTFARQWAQGGVDRAPAIVLVTDGYPTQCTTDPSAVAALVQNAYNATPSIRTFVIGAGANSAARFNLDSFARSGGTQSAFVVEDGNFARDFVDAVSKMAASLLACDFAIPPPPAGQTLNPELVQLVYTAPASTAEEVPKVASSAACAQATNGGWYYDDPARPARIHVCPCTCSRFATGRVEVRFGCRPRLP
jgi:hypothetical protein